MRIILTLLVALFILNFLGWGLSGLLNRGQPLARRVMTLPLGYALGQVAFLGFFLAGLAPIWSLLASLTVAGILNLIHALHAGSGVRRFRLALDRDMLGLALASALILGLAAWPHMRSGWGNYWHSGNPDIVDALNGRDFILDRHYDEPPIKTLLRIMPAPTQQGEDYYFSEYIGSTIRAQYTSVAFWSLALGAPKNMDAFLIQAYLNLVLLGHGVWWLMRLALGATPRAAFLGSLGAVLCVFQFTTFLNGHEGTMMFGAVAPHLTLLGIFWAEGRIRGPQPLAQLSILVLFLANCYPFPLGYFLLPLAAYVLHLRMLTPHQVYRRTWNALCRTSPLRRGMILAAGLLLAGIGIYLAWEATTPLRTRAATEFRSWRLMLTIYRDPLYWGLWPSPIAFNESKFLDVYGIIRDESRLGTLVAAISQAAAWGLWLLALGAAWTNRTQVSGYVRLFVVMFPFFFIGMRFFIGDPYYLYKMLYTTQFVLVATLFSTSFGPGVERPSRLGKLTTARSVKVLLLAWLALNLAHDVAGDINLTQRSYNNNFAAYREVSALPGEYVTHSYLDIPIYNIEWILRHHLASFRKKPLASPDGADYYLRMTRHKDIITRDWDQEDLAWSNDTFSLYKAPRTDVLHLDSPFPVEAISSAGGEMLPFRWMSESALKKPEGFTLRFKNLTPEARYLRLCMESGPSFSYSPFDLSVYERGNPQPFQDFHVAGRTCQWIPAERLADRELPLSFHTRRESLSILPYDERKLNYKLSQVGLAPQAWDRGGLIFLNLRRDIVPAAGIEALHSGVPLPPDTLLLGNAWHVLEDGQERFRWVQDRPEILVMNRSTQPLTLLVQAEAQPLPDRPATLALLDHAGKLLGKARVQDGRATVEFRLPPGCGDMAIYRLECDTPLLASGADPRPLRFRVFSLSLAPADPAVSQAPPPRVP